MMKTTYPFLAGIVAATLVTTAFALTTQREISPDYARQHPDEFHVSAAKGKEGLIEFTVTHNVTTPMYHVAHLSINDGGKLIATSDTPTFGKRRDNKFHFSIAADHISESSFSLSDSVLDPSGEVPVPGTVVYHFRLADFVAKK